MKHFLKSLKFATLVVLVVAVGMTLELGIVSGLSLVMGSEWAVMTWILIHCFALLVLFFYNQLERD